MRALDAGDDPGKARILVGVDGKLAGAVVMGDSLREDVGGLVERLRSLGVRHVALVTGDRVSVAEEVGRQIGADRVYAEQSPEGKLEVIRSIREQPELTPVVMVGLITPVAGALLQKAIDVGHRQRAPRIACLRLRTTRKSNRCDSRRLD